MFGKNIRLFNLLGFEVKVDLSWIIIAILIAWSLSTGLFPFRYRDLSPQTYWIMGIVGALGLFLSIIVHEFSHSVVARRFGIPMRGITLFIFGGVAEMGEEPPSPRAEFFMAVAGPLSSIAIALIFYGISAAGVESFSQPLGGVIRYLAWINAVLAGFNLIPAFPLDGGRVLRSILWHVQGSIRKATRISSTIGSGFGIFLIIMGVFNFISGNVIGGMWWFLIGMFVKSAADASYRQLITRRALEGEPLSRFMKKDPVVVSPSIPVDRFVEDYIYKYHYKMFPIVEDGDRLVGCVTTQQVKALNREDWKDKKVSEIAQQCSIENTIRPDADAVEALSTMHRTGSSRLMVVSRDKLVGVIALKDMMQWLSLKMDLEEA
ncbi:MAG: site-2 protease family protein [Desulfobacteraceae bacterium]|nr:MAG: site-2 protease family protein [Desulfobacteraceae bacterium]